MQTPTGAPPGASPGAKARPEGAVVPNLGLALAYFGLAQLGMLADLAYGTDTNSGHAAAGVALAGLLILGERAWPGVWVGSFLAGVSQDASPAGVAQAAIVATGAALAGWLGIRLTRRTRAGSPLPPADRDIGTFLLLAGPLACAVMATFGVGAQLGLGGLPVADAPTRWIAWWARDCVSVFLVAPLALSLWPWRRWRLGPYAGSGAQESRLIALPLLLTVIALSALHAGITRAAHDYQQQVRKGQMAEAFAGLSLDTAQAVQSVAAVERLYAANVEVEADEFAVFTKYMLRESGMVAVEWVPRRTSEEGGVSYPMAFIEPRALRPQFEAWDLMTNPDRLRAMDTARDTGAPSATAPLFLGSVQRLVLRVFVPVYDWDGGASSDAVDARRRALSGFVVAILDVADLVRGLATASARDGLRFRVSEVTEVSEDTEAAVLSATLPSGAQAEWTKDLAFSNRRWRVDMASATVAHARRSDLEERRVGVAALLLAGIVSFATLGVAGRAAATRAQVEARTADLRDELVARKQLVARVDQRSAELESANIALALASEEAQQANRAKSAFLATMSHEIRTPMNGVVGMVELLDSRNLPPREAEAARTIRDSAYALLRVVDHILDFSKIEAGHVELEVAAGSLADLIEGVCVSLVPLAAACGVDLVVFVSPALPASVWIDHTRLRQILNNLLGNAIKFSAASPGRRGRVVVRAELAEGVTPRFCLTVADNGIGMSEAVQEQLFVPFQQGEVSTTRRFGGTGLGLVISKRLVERMSGALALTSAPHAGATFTVTLPLSPAPAPRPPWDLDLSGVDCLLLAGGLTPMADLRAYLEAAGARVHAASTADATRQASALACAVVLQDVGHGPTPIDALASVDGPTVRHVLLTRGGRSPASSEGLPQEARVCWIDADALRRAALVRAVAVAVGRAAPDIVRSAEEAAFPIGALSPPSLEQARAEGRLILVAEDDPTNRRVLQAQLSRLGYAAEFAHDGAQALNLWRAGRYGLVIADVHMPELDGYGLVRAIRREERGGAPLPVLALSANALRGEAERARAAGMQAYLTKPVQLRDLQAALEGWMPLPAGAIDLRVLSALVGPDEAVLRDLLTHFGEASRELVAAIDAAHVADDPLCVAEIAHRLKSGAAAVGAQGLAEVCSRLEAAGNGGDRAELSRGLPKLHVAWAAVHSDLTRILG